ncbi:MAG: helix-turn-helix transcriptional regulator [Lachnospiraceae bacterium]|nr:helix-turn-helix transcriptional regulator [Candidatus Colinaster equi]
MILADKIINERKKNGWSQEELAEKLSVSRQAVSKWESAQAIPDIQKIVLMAQVFGVSTDYLLKDDIENVERGTEIVSMHDSTDSVPPKRFVSMQEANDYIKFVKSNAPRLANAVALCIVSPVLLIVLCGLSDEGGFAINEAIAGGIGLISLFGFIAYAVYNFIVINSKEEKYRYLDYNLIDTEYGVTGMVKERKEAFSERYTRGIALGVILCILACVPLFVAAMFEAKDYILVVLTGVLLIIIAFGVDIIIRVCNVMEAYNKLLEENDYAKNIKKNKKVVERYSSLYWSVAVVVYLGWSFLSGRWHFTWIVWPIAGVLFAVYIGIVKSIYKVED